MLDVLPQAKAKDDLDRPEPGDWVNRRSPPPSRPRPSVAAIQTGGTLENAQAMAAHESPCTTKLYDHTGDKGTLDEVERISI